MTQKYWDNDIDKHTDWGGDSSTGNLPVSGGKVQKFVKTTLEKKMGVIYYDSVNNRYLVFADEENRDKYIESPLEWKSLILGTFDAPANYFAEIMMITPLVQSIHKSQKNNFIEFTFDIKNKTGVSIGDSVQCTYTINNAQGKKVVHETYNTGETARFLADPYLTTGRNTITVSILGETTLAATSSSIVITVVELLYSPEFNFQNALSPTGTLAIPYTISGAGVKYIEYYIDGTIIGTPDAITDVSANRTKYIQLSNLESGRHTLQTRAYVISNEQKFYTGTNYWDFAVTGGSEILILVATVVDEPVEDFLVIKGEQYKQLSFDWAVYDPQQKIRVVTFTLAGEVISTVETSNNRAGVFNHFLIIYGQNTLYISCGGYTRTIDIYAAKSSIGIQEAVEGRILKLSAVGRSNSDVNKNVWENNGYHTTFNGFSWNENQGWSNGALVISKGANIEIDIRPLATNYATQGGTIEIEFEATLVEDEEAVVCECLDDMTGAGIIIKATSATIQSSGGAKVTTQFNAGDRLKLAFIVNKTSGTEFAQLAFIANNGMLERAINYSPTDSFVCNETLKIGDTTGKTSIRLYSIRVYNRALTAEEEFGNYVLDSSNIDTLVDKNDVFIEGSTMLSVDKIARKLPVMIITADLNTLMASMDKSLSIYGDIVYINNQDPTKSFTTQGSRIRLQGTSSLGYPRKNYRFYTKLGSYGTMLDYKGEQLPGGKYSFKDGAQPTDRWCLKADYAESSMTHNTGIARLWNDLMRDAQIDGQFRCRTQAQQAAKDNGFPYDVRTCIDGFPIVCFYRQNYDEELICLGQYNFNNDKSSENVFGFKGIPGFDNSRVECWEILNNTHPLTTFTSPENFDEEWQDAFEARYPNVGELADTTNLKDFITWASTTSREAGAVYGSELTVAPEIKTDSDKQYGAPLLSYIPNGTYADTPENRLLKFQKEKWDYLDVFKVAAYYVYLMRFGAVDQVVKNAMFTTEGTQGVGTHNKWYFINYDNDTVMGLRNDARLIYKYDIDRQTLDETLEGVYAYMGHDSTLWNNLEADEEFMRIVRTVDTALYGAGLTYDNVIDMFDNKQSGKWCERIYNENSKYKYIQPFYESGVNNLFMLQGSRKSHRHWWLKNRFDLYDAKWVSGAYKSKVIEFKAPGANTSFSIVAGKKLRYGYGINQDPIETNVVLEEGESHTFVLSRTLAIGDPVRVYAATGVRELNVSNFKTQIAQFNMQNAYDSEFGGLFKKLILGNADSTQNTALTDISGLSNVPTMEYLDIRGFMGLTFLNLSTLPNMKTFLAASSGLTSFVPAVGTKFDLVSLPTGLQTLVLEDTDITTLQYTPTVNLREVSLINATGVDWSVFCSNWYNTLSGSGNPSLLQNAKLTLEGIHWEGLTVQQLKNLSYFGTWSIKGYVKLVSITESEINELIAIFGEEAFQAGSNFIIDAPPAIYMRGQAQVVSGKSAQYTATIFPPYEEYALTFSIVGAEMTYEPETGNRIFVLNGNTLYADTGLLVTTKNYSANQNLTIKVTAVGSTTIEATMNVVVQKITFPTAVTINGESSLNGTGSFPYTLLYTGEFTAEIVSVVWTLTPEDENAQLSNKTNNSCNIIVNTPITENRTLSVNVNFENNFSLTASIEISFTAPGVIMTSTSNPAVLAICYAQGWCASPNYMTEQEAALVSNIGLAFSHTSNNTDIKSFDEFEYFTGITALPQYAFRYNTAMASIKLPPQLTDLGTYAFQFCSELSSIVIPEGITIIGDYSFYSCSKLVLVTLPEGVTKIGNSAFYGTSKLQSMELPSTLKSIEAQAFSYSGLVSITIPEGVTTLQSACFNGATNLVTIDIPSTVTTMGMSCFSMCSKLTGITFPSGISFINASILYGCRSLKTITALRLVSPSLGSNPFGADASTWTGRNTYNTGENRLYVKQGATGYDTGAWLDPLQHPDKCGFTISYTL